MMGKICIFCRSVSFSKYCGLVVFVFFMTSSGQHSFHELTETYEVVVPRIVASINFNEDGTKEAFPSKLLVEIRNVNSTIVLRLKKNSVSFPQSLLLWGDQEVDTTTEESCYYQGKVFGEKHSEVAVSLCRGLTGLIEFQSHTFYIEPLTQYENISVVWIEREHILYPISTIDGDQEHLECNSSDDVQLQKLLPHNQRSQRDASRYRKAGKVLESVKFLELYIVNDYSVYIHHNQNVTEVLHRSKLIANILDSRYRHLRIRIVLVGIEVWTKKNEIIVSSSSHTTLMNFMKYRREHINRRMKNDNAQFITKQSFDNGETAGKAAISTICSHKYSAGINHDSKSNPIYVANVIAHELGHNLGMHHDHNQDCSCTDHPRDRCIMNKKLDKHVASFSKCSYDHMAKLLMSGHGHCLFDFPEDRKKPASCGNGVIEHGEECDCGHETNCAKNGFCCNPVTCLLNANATCASGDCCHQCQFTTKGQICREQRGECDLPEYCGGYSGECPPDLHVQDTSECEAGSGYCIGGVCQTHTHQCRHQYGNSSYTAVGRCYQYLNTLGSEEGYCSVDEADFIACEADDVYCGKLHCVESAGHLYHSNAVEIEIWNDTYKGTCATAHQEVHEDENEKWLGLVRDGTRCGKHRICRDNKCIPLAQYQAKLLTKSCVLACHHHGICNNKGNCHCHHGWRPPYCDQPGNGGSIDGGTPIVYYRSESIRQLRSAYGRPGFAIVTILVVVLVLVVLVFSRKSLGKVCHKINDVTEKRLDKIKASELAALLDADEDDAESR